MAEGASHRKQYLLIWVYLAVLTLLEIGIAEPSLGLDKTLVVLGLVLMAVAKAALVLFYYMHLREETAVMRYTVILPLFFPPFYALVLMAEGYARLNGVW